MSKEYFLCDNCKGKDFIKLRNFSVHFRNVNFSDELIYDEVSEEIYQCVHCKKTFTKKEIETGIKGLIDKKKKNLSHS